MTSALPLRFRLHGPAAPPPPSGAVLQIQNAFGSSPALNPSLFYDPPGGGAPAISIADYYHMDGCYWFRCYDLLTMGSPGAAVAAANKVGGVDGRYIWLTSPDHPSAQGFSDASDIVVGYSTDPGVMPETMTAFLQYNNLTTVTGSFHNGHSIQLYEVPWLVYNPGDATTPFWVYLECWDQTTGSNAQFYQGLVRTSGFTPATSVVEPAILFHQFTNDIGLSAYQRVVRVNSTTWKSTGELYPDLGDPTPGNAPLGSWTSPNGLTWATNVTLTNVIGVRTFGRSSANPVTVSGQLYSPGVNLRFGGASTGGAWATLVPVDSNLNVLASPAEIVLSSTFNNQYPGPEFAQDVNAYEEDGILHVFVMLGFYPSAEQYHTTNLTPNGYYLYQTANTNATTAAGSTVLHFATVPVGVEAGGYVSNLTTPGTITVNPITAVDRSTPGAHTVTMFDNIQSPGVGNGDSVYFWRGGLLQEHINYYTMIIDGSAARLAAPIGAKASCISGVVTITWMNALPQNTYRVKRYTSSANAVSDTSPTTVGDVTGFTITDSPTPGSQYWYRVITLDSGAERQSRIVNTYVS